MDEAERLDRVFKKAKREVFRFLEASTLNFRRRPALSLALVGMFPVWYVRMLDGL
jgi:hypothetical protein